MLIFRIFEGIMHSSKFLIERLTGLLIFEVDGKDYCVDYADVVSTLIPPLEPSLYSRPEGTNNYLLSFNKKNIPLICLKKFLSSNTEERLELRSARVIIIEDKDEQYGLLVDKIKEIIALDSKYIADKIKFNPVVYLPGDLEEYKFLEGSIEIDKRCLLLLNTNLVVDNFTVHLN